jgi:two-component system sensor histidine kinase YcbA
MPIKQSFRDFEKMMILVIFTTFMGQLYVKPFASDFRLTFAVVVLNIALLTVKGLKPFLTINLVGIMMLLVRSVLYTIEGGPAFSFFDGLVVYYPVLFFYIFYALFFVGLDVIQLAKNPFLLFVSLWICDSLPNLVEFIVRRGWEFAAIESAVYTIISIGLARTLFTVILYWLSRYYIKLIENRRQRDEFIKNILVRSHLKTELFFLKKSKADIEEAMQKSYALYESSDNPTQKEALLAVAKDIHEIKKDYSRVISGMDKTLTLDSTHLMTLKEIIDIVVDSNRKVASMQDKKIRIDSKVHGELYTDKFMPLISVLNNIVINAVEAIEYTGSINIDASPEVDNWIIRITDSGPGLLVDNYEVIYKPGYSTKYDVKSGVMNSGVGLTHVKELVETIFKGQVYAQTERGRYTRFVLTLSKSVLMEADSNGL